MKKLVIPTLLILLTSACTNRSSLADAYGNFEATEYLLSSETTGKVVSINVNEGDIVTADLPFALIDTTQLAIKKLQLTTTTQKLEAQKRQITSSLEVYKTQKVVAEKEYNRIKQLLKDGAATQKQFDDVDGQLQVIESQINNSQTQYIAVEADKIILKAKIEEIDDQIQRSQIKSPITGTVLEKYIEQGELVTIGKTIVKVADLNEMLLRAYISGTQLPNLKIGQKVKVLIDKTAKENQELEGEVSWISSTAEFTPKIIQTKEERVNLVYAVKIKVKNDGSIKIGMPGEIIF